MQYPIIDNLIYAYLANGWTGLNYTDNANFNIFPLVDGWYNIQNEFSATTLNGVKAIRNFISVKPGDIISLQYYNYPTATTLPTSYRYWKDILFYDINKSFLSAIQTQDTIQNNVLTVTVPNNAYYIRYSLRTYENGTEYIYLKLNGIQREFSGNTTNLTDIKNRLKLPMIHYFPHPVIDAIISAADGQHTEEEKEILRHYLTPLGIGGI